MHFWICSSFNAESYNCFVPFHFLLTSVSNCNNFSAKPWNPYIMLASEFAYKFTWWRKYLFVVNRTFWDKHIRLLSVHIFYDLYRISSYISFPSFCTLSQVSFIEIIVISIKTYTLYKYAKICPCAYFGRHCCESWKFIINLRLYSWQCETTIKFLCISNRSDF